MSDPINYIDANGETPLVIVGVAGLVGGVFGGIANVSNGGSFFVGFAVTGGSVLLAGLSAILLVSVSSTAALAAAVGSFTAAQATALGITALTTVAEAQPDGACN